MLCSIAQTFSLHKTKGKAKETKFVFKFSLSSITLKQKIDYLDAQDILSYSSQ